MEKITYMLLIIEIYNLKNELERNHFFLNTIKEKTWLYNYKLSIWHKKKIIIIILTTKQNALSFIFISIIYLCMYK